ncbi:transglycosylase SLT domain-containing protein [Candidatus Albibeggiatoa sp. nov. BB20]|uniref:transglycosylase SLT domain-containing protein n=1 Tax=Candidatus Albibeggiatoa sp. nov. BB20 TaxID=3162723 RepID=UPI00336597F5
MRRPGTRDLESSNLPSWLRRLLGLEEETQPTTQAPVVQQPTQPTTPAPQPTRPTPQPVANRFDTTYSYGNATMSSQLREAERYKSVIEAAAKRYGFQPSVLCGIGSRESHWGLALRPAGPAGTGDFTRRRARGSRTGTRPPDGGGYGRGLMQIDYDWHEFARTGNWRIASDNIYYACTVLNNAQRFFGDRVSLNERDRLRAMIAAYNGGATATLRAIQAGKDIDGNTTGKDYSRDVLNRSGWFQLHGWP